MLDAASVARPIQPSFNDGRYCEFCFDSDGARYLLRKSLDSFFEGTVS